jgi:hypothetical protein
MNSDNSEPRGSYVTGDSVGDWVREAIDQAIAHPLDPAAFAAELTEEYRRRAQVQARLDALVRENRR